MALLSALETEIAIPVCAVVGIAYSYSLARWFGKLGDSEILHNERLGIIALRRMPSMMRDISKVAEAFLLTEYQYGGVFMVAFAILIFLCLGSVESFSTQSRPCRFNPSNVCKPALATAVFSAVSFLLGAFTSVLSGYLGMQIAIYANARNVFEECKGVGKGFFYAFRTGAVLGFLLAVSGLLVLYIAINLLKLYYGNDWEGLFEAIAGYGLGVSFMALFGRAAGGIYAKAADGRVHLHKETQPNYLKDGRNSAVITYFVGNLVGDIAGTGTDLFGSYAESACAALVVASISSFGDDHDFTAMCYPLLISSMGILVCFMTTLFTASFLEIKDVKEIKPAVRKQLIISTILMTFGIVIVSWIALPPSFTVYNFGSQKVVKNWQLCFCVGVGLWAGLIIGLVANLYIDNDISLFQEIAAERVGFGLAFVKIPIFAFLSILLSYRIASVYGIAVAAVGMLSTIATRLAINAYSPISANAKRVAKIVGGRGLRDMLSSSNTRAIIGKGFAIESTSLVSMALFGAFVSRAAISPVDVLTPKVFMGSIVGAMLPKWFYAMTMKRVGPAALEMANRIPRESNHYRRFFKIPVDASFTGMIRPVALVMLTPLIVGTFLGVEMLSGVLAGSLGSVVQIAISGSNTGGAWEEAKKYINAGASEYAETRYPTESIICQAVNEAGGLLKDTSGPPLGIPVQAGASEHAETHDPTERTIHRAVDEGNTIGDPLENTSGPPLNILVRAMVVESLVFAPFFTTHGGLLFKIF